MDEHQHLIDRLRGLRGGGPSPERQARDLAAMADASRARAVAGKLRVGGALLAGLLLGGSGFAAAGALPDPAQHVAHTVLDRVGVEVPDPERYHGPECGAEVLRNHGAYVRGDKALATSDCGKPVKAPGGPDDDAAEPGEDPAAPEGCRGKPPWAEDKSMSAEEKRAAQADRAARCRRADGDGADALGTDADDAATTTISPTTTSDVTATTEAPTTTTTEPPTTTTATSAP